MQIQQRLRDVSGITVVEIAILVVLGSAIGLGSIEYFRATERLRRARSELGASRGTLGVVADELRRQFRRADRHASQHGIIRTAATHDTLEIYIAGKDVPTVDTLRYFVNRFDEPPSLIMQRNRETPEIFAQGVDSVTFVASGGSPPENLSVVLVTTEFGPDRPSSRRRLGETIALRAH